MPLGSGACRGSNDRRLVDLPRLSQRGAVAEARPSGLTSADSPPAWTRRASRRSRKIRAATWIFAHQVRSAPRLVLHRSCPSGVGRTGMGCYNSPTSTSIAVQGDDRTSRQMGPMREPGSRLTPSPLPTAGLTSKEG
jgi:hypothetical protein